MQVCMPTYCNIRCAVEKRSEISIALVVEHDSRRVTANTAAHNNNNMIVIILIIIIKTLSVSLYNTYIMHYVFQHTRTLLEGPFITVPFNRPYYGTP